MLERIYGVTHGGELEVVGLRVSDIFIGPSRQSMRDLLTLPEGSSVGIETCPELEKPFEVRGQPIDVDKSTDFYWQRIKKLCQRKNLEVVYLEDFATYQKYVEKLVEVESLYRRLEGELVLGGLPDKVTQRIYKTQTEADHIFYQEREEKLLERIQETKPTVVILGRGHTDHLIKSKGFKKRGIEPKQYLGEEVIWSESFSLAFPEKRYQRAESVSPLTPDKKLILQKKLEERSYRAVTEGRVMANKTPDYIGTWDVHVPARGLFEIYLDKKDKSGMGTGIIENCLGTGKILFSKFENHEVCFLKKYKPQGSSGSAAKDEILYEGFFLRSAKDEATGTYYSPRAGNGHFNLRRFNNTPYQVNP